jgi:hypothetical protein
MLRRARWFGAGAAVGVATSLWARRKLKTTALRYHPAGLAGSAVGRARAWPGEVRAAIDEGRTTMRQREAELRHGLERAAGS